MKARLSTARLPVVKTEFFDSGSKYWLSTATITHSSPPPQKERTAAVAIGRVAFVQDGVVVKGSRQAAGAIARLVGRGVVTVARLIDDEAACIDQVQLGFTQLVDTKKADIVANGLVQKHDGPVFAVALTGVKDLIGVVGANRSRG